VDVGALAAKVINRLHLGWIGSGQRHEGDLVTLPESNELRME
jgi:hypothetical protein